MHKKLIGHNVPESSHLCLFINALNLSKDIHISKNLTTLHKSKSESSLNITSKESIGIKRNVQIAQDINYKFKSDNRPYVKIKIHNNVYNALLDSGASISIIGKDYENLWNRSDNVNHQRKIQIRIANGEMLESMSIKNLPIFYNNVKKHIEFAFVPMVVYPLILGMNFFNQFNFGFCVYNDINNAESKNDFNLCELSEDNSKRYEEKIYMSPKAQHKLDSILKKFKYNDNGNLGCQKLIKHSTTLEMNIQ